MRGFIVLVFCVCYSIGVSAKKDHLVEGERDEIDLIAEDDVLLHSNPRLNAVDGLEDFHKDACAHHHCGAGKECIVNDLNKPTCACVRDCPPEKDERRKVCSNHNETWNSYCEVYRMRCLCKEDSEECSRKKYRHVHVEYYGTCRELQECSEEELADFPRRMREWLFNVMQDLVQHHELKGYYAELEKEAEKSITRKWVNAVIWKFCDLDTHPEDRAVSRHELFPLRAPLMVMEHCISTFLNQCDANNDKMITLTEWGVCLGLEENEILDKCAAVRGKH